MKLRCKGILVKEVSFLPGPQNTMMRGWEVLLMYHVYRLVAVWFALLLASAPLAAGSDLILVANGQSRYRIVIDDKASPSEQHAARELQGFLEQISGVRLPILDDRADRTDYEILVGNSGHLFWLDTKVDWDYLGDEGFVIRTVGNYLIIAGGRKRGTMYGVYHFLEEYLGCRWFTSKVSFIPRRPYIRLYPLDDVQVPALEYREPFYTDAFDADWCARNKMNSANSRLDAQRGGKVTYGTFVHTFNAIIPPDQYFDEHPDYFSERDGKRIKDYSQLCLTNPQVVKLAIAKVKEWIQANPEANIFSVSQNDWGNWCECPNCRALDEREGSHAATMIHFVNQIAEAVEKDYPHVAIDTLAYQYTRHPPRTIKPHHNVIVRLCSIECCFSHPLATDDYPQNVSFRDDIVGWSRLTQRLYVWDYVTDFPHYLLPFPNFKVLKPNIQFFVKHGVKGIFEEGNYAPGGGGEFAELRAYVLAKLLWNPNYNVAKAINDFMEGYYGDAAKEVRAYFDLLHDQIAAKGTHLVIWAGPQSPYLTEEVMARADRLLRRAEEKVQHDAEVLNRVKMARLPVQYVQIANGWIRHHRWVVREGLYQPTPNDPRARLIRDFVNVVQANGITQHREGGSMAAFTESLLKTIAPRPVVTLENPQLSLQIVPSLGGRILQIRHRSRLWDFLAASPPTVEDYPAAGGYTEAVDNRENGLGRTEEYTYEIRADEQGQSVVMAANLANGLHVDRTVTLPSTGSLFTITTTVKNTSEKTQTVGIQTATDYRLASLENAEFQLLDGSGKTRRMALAPSPKGTPGQLTLGPLEPPQSTWVLLNRQLNLGLRYSTPEALQACTLTALPQRYRVSVRQGLAGRDLASGESLTVTQTYEVLTDLAGLLIGPVKEAIPAAPALGGA